MIFNLDSYIIDISCNEWFNITYLQNVRTMCYWYNILDKKSLGSKISTSSWNSIWLKYLKVHHSWSKHMNLKIFKIHSLI
jgi:hypothetical protein